jgi:hypothetical protein
MDLTAAPTTSGQSVANLQPATASDFGHWTLGLGFLKNADARKLNKNSKDLELYSSNIYMNYNRNSLIPARWPHASARKPLILRGRQAVRDFIIQ